MRVLNESNAYFCGGYCVVTLYHKAHFLSVKAPDLEINPDSKTRNKDR